MSKKEIHIIGGGIVGLCSAYFLHQEGVKVTVVDEGDLTDGTSHGNAGMIVPSHFVPLASPGVIAQGIKWMFDSKSPFYIKPRLSLDLAQWMWRFYRSCNRQHVNRAIPVLFEFNEQSKGLYKELAEKPELSFHYEEKGLLMLYRTKHQEEDEIQMAEKANQLGVEAKILSSEEVRNLEPDIHIQARGGLYFPGDAHLYPNVFIQQMISYLKNQGVEFRTGARVENFKTENGKVSSILLSNKEVISVENILLCGGSWTAQMLKKLGIHISLQDGKGYSITMKNQDLRPQIPTILSEAKVAITPMANDLRIGGTLEISNFTKGVNQKRLQGIIESVPKYYPDLDIVMPDHKDVWFGYRPCTPDGMPYIDQSKELGNLYVATGHGMMGMSLGPATGKMVSEIFVGKKPSISNELMRLGRF